MAAKEEPPRHAFDPRLASVAYWGVVAAQLPVMAGVALFAPTAMNAAWAFWMVCTGYRCIMQLAYQTNTARKRSLLRIPAALYGEALIMIVPAVLGIVVAGLLKRHGL